MFQRTLAPAFVLLTLALSGTAQTLLGPTQYFSSSDSPFPVGSPGFVLENFEDGLFNVPGVSASTGFVTGTVYSGSIIDSVDGDDGVLGNGTCTECDSYFAGPGSPLSFSFDANVLGGLPTQVGIVWTDGGLGCSVTFQAFDSTNALLGTLTAPNLGDGSNSGTVDEDRFFGIDFAGGILRIQISNDSGGLEVDHLQYRVTCAGPIAASYCTSKQNSLGCTPLIAGLGTASASASNGFTLSASNVRNNKSGLLFYGVSGRSGAAFQGGFLCVKAPIKRTPAVNSGGGGGNTCLGVYSIDMNAFARGALGGTPLPALSVAGTLVNCQWWGRDPGFVAPNNTTLSGGLEYLICP